MCVVCVEWAKGNLTDKEALNALGEMVWSSDTAEEQDHYVNLAEEIDQASKDKK
jgi:hypothetical protein